MDILNSNTVMFVAIYTCLLHGTLRTGCSDLGMARGTIPNNDITSSSVMNSISYAYYARLGNRKAWTADRFDKHPWIQVNLQKGMNITAIAVQGLKGSGYITRFYLSYGDDGNAWMNYTVQGETKVFQANADDTNTVKVDLSPSVMAQYIRLHPTNCSNRCTLKMEIYGCNSTAGLPGRPSSLAETSISTNSISITWNAPAVVGDGITGHNVRWLEDGASNLTQKVITGNRVATLDNLTPYTWYIIQVQAYTNKGEGPWSVPLQVRSGESVPSAAPGNFKLGSSSPLSLNVSWDAIPVKQQQGNLLGYRINYTKEGSGNEQNVTVGPDQLSYTIKGLEFASYSVKVAGYTAVGVGIFTASLTKIPNEGAPSPPRNLQLFVLTSKAIKVTWLEPLTKNGNIRRYVVAYGRGRDNLDTFKYTSETVTEYLLSPLEEYTDYFVQVSAETVVSGKPSNIEQARTIEDAPSSDPVIRRGQDETKAEDAHTIRVAWQEIILEDQNGVITGYTVFYNVKDQAAQFSQNRSGSETSTVITGLKPYTDYCIKVAGYTKAGRSPLKEPCYYVETLQKGPSHPRDVVVQATSSETIDVTWKESAILNGVIQRYIISFGLRKDYQDARAEVTGSTFKRTLVGLKKFTTYYIKVRGKTTETGNASRILNATTFEDRPSPPTQFRGQVISDADVLLSWGNPVNANGIIRKYYIKTYDTKTGRQVNIQEMDALRDTKNQKMISSLKPLTNYTFTIQAVTIKAGEMANFTARTKEGVPSEPTDVRASLQENGNINVNWKEPDDPNGILIGYKVYCEGRRSYNTSFKIDIHVTHSETSRFTVIRKALLKPGTEFTVYVTAFTRMGEGARSESVVVNTPSTAPPAPAPPRIADDNITPTTITIVLTPTSDSNGEVVAHQVVVEKVGKVSKQETAYLPDEISGYKEAKANGGKFYIAASFARGKLNGPREFVLGDGNTYGGYKNAPLEPETKYKAYIRGVTKFKGKWIYGEPAAISLPPTATHSRKPSSSSSNLIIILIIIILILLAIIPLVSSNLARFICVQRRRNKDSANIRTVRNETEHHESSLLNPANAARELGMSIATGDRNDEGTNQHRAQVYKMEDEYAELNPRTMTSNDSCCKLLVVSQEGYCATGDHYESPTTTNEIPEAESPTYVNKVSVPESLTYNKKPPPVYENVP